MKSIQKSVGVFAIVLIIASCTKKETTPPTAGETNSLLLAGAKGASKSWAIASISQSENGGAAQTVTPATTSNPTGIPACESDNVFQFSYNTGQSYQQTEGATSCTSGDPSTIESGSWAFTDDGKTLLVDAIVNATSTQLQSTAEPFLGYMILEYGGPLSVVQITATTLTVSYSFVDNTVSPANTYLITLVFSVM
jgi:hypothetical protein